MIYDNHIKAIADLVSNILKNKDSSEDYNPFLDEDLVTQIICGEAKNYGMSNGWYGPVHNRYGSICEDLNFAASQMIAGASPSIELSFDGQYRKDMFRDVSLGALHHDISLELKIRYPNIECYSFCERSG